MLTRFHVRAHTHTHTHTHTHSLSLSLSLSLSVLQVLKELIAMPTLPIPVTITAISTSMALLAEEQTMVTIDPTHFLKELFVHMNDVVFHPDIFHHVLSCINLLLIRRKEVGVHHLLLACSCSLPGRFSFLFSLHCVPLPLSICHCAGSMGKQIQTHMPVSNPLLLLLLLFDAGFVLAHRCRWSAWRAC